MQNPFYLRAWQSALNVAVKTRAATDRFPRRGYSELKLQMIDSAESIAHNIAEGRGSESQREFNRYLDTASRSANETLSQVRMAMEYGIIPERRGKDLLGSIECTRGLIESLQRKIRADLLREACEEKQRKQPKQKRRGKRSSTRSSNA